jgi:hypothetical protein
MGSGRFLVGADASQVTHSHLRSAQGGSTRSAAAVVVRWWWQRPANSRIRRAVDAGVRQ